MLSQLGSLDGAGEKAQPTIAFHVPSYAPSASEGLFPGQAKTPSLHRSIHTKVRPTRLAQGGGLCHLSPHAS